MNQRSDIGYGLLPLEKDLRDFSVGGTFGDLPKEKLPEIDFVVCEPLEIKNQYQSDMCAAFSSTAVAEDQEGVPLSAEYVFAKAKQLRGEYNEWGLSLRDVCKVFVKTGAVEKQQAPLTLENSKRDIIANWENWDDLTKLDNWASLHKKQAYFAIEGGYDLFDNIRANLWRFKAEKRTIFTGCTWRPSWTYAPKGVIPVQKESGGYGHAFKIFGQKIINGQPYLIAQLSNGKNIGDNGLFYFQRTVVNREFIYGAYMFQDLHEGLTIRTLKDVPTTRKLYRAIRNWWTAIFD